MNPDRVSGALLFVFALLFVWQAGKLPFGSIRAPDSGLFPLSFAIALAAVSALGVLISSTRNKASTPNVAWSGSRRVITVVLVLSSYAFVIERVGYLLSTTLVMLLLLRGVARLEWRPSVAISVSSVLVTYFLFRLLGVPLPQGVVPL